MSRNTSSEQALSPTTTMESSNMDRHDSFQHSSKRTFRARSTKTTSKRNAKSSAKKHGSRGAEGVSEEEGDAADEEDSSAEQDDNEDDVEEPEVLAPSDRIKPAKHHLNASKMTKLNRAGRINGGDIASKSKKRTFSDIKNNSVLSEEEDTRDQTPTAYPRKKSQRRLSNTHGFLTYDDNLPASSRALQAAIDSSSDDDDVYNAVDLISDSDDDEKSMEKLEEKAILESELEDPITPRAKGAESDDDSDIGDMDFSMDLSTMGANSFFAEQMDQLHDDQTLLLLRYQSPSPQPSPTTRKVHFADLASEAPDSSETSSDTAELPDIFSHVTMNLPMVQSIPRVDDNDSYYSNSNSEDGSYWDWREEDASQNAPTANDPQRLTMEFSAMPIPVTDDDEAGASSGYDSDSSGDTTEDDMPPPPSVTTPKATLRSYKPPGRKSTFRHAGRPSRSLPILGQFVLDRSKAVAYRHKSMGIVVHPPRDPNHELARFFPPSDTSGSVQNSPQTPFQNFNPEDSDFSDVSRNPFSGTLDVMFSGMFGGASNQTYNFGGQVIGPPEAFYPFKSIDSTGSVFDLDDGSYDDDDDDDDYEDQMDIHDFIQFGGSEDEDDEDVGMSYVETTAAEESDAFSPTSPAPTDASSAMTPFRANSISMSEMMLTPAPSQSMLEHLDRGFVTSFRNNQDRAKLLSRQPHGSLAYASTPQAIRSGYTDSVITPMRKQKSSRKDAAKMKMSGSGASPSKIGKKRDMKPPRRPKLPPRGFF
ncbi:hypothetical protein NA57DRAFT_77437 [Rhizodiscina lignyota]|uniref:Uncharacterized protein n=1 Tax=Rhizodiscina lignyota TaxID=1504668 RepID=A0A9P4M4Q9_9PEZI|nr:hypothetical protein NA57DRAFT_77437 [Rhizodiscina lignyota]